MQIVMARGREIPVTTRKRCATARQAAEALFVKPETLTKTTPRILEDISKERVETAKAASTAIAIVNETEHQKVFRLVKEGEFEVAARIAARLINADDDAGFFVYGQLPSYRRADAWFQDMVQTAKRSASTTIHNITPELSQILLLNNDGNRRVKAANLSRIMRDIVSDRWELNGESIIIAKDGRVNDGQHRNFAVVLTGRPIKSVMSLGLSRDSMRTIDIGEKRQAKDRLGIAGVSDYIRLSAIAALAFETYNKRQATPSEADDYFHSSRDMIERAASATGVNMKGVGPSAAGVAALHLLKFGHEDAEIKAFFAKVRSGEMLTKNDPRMTLHRAIFVDKYKLKLSRDNWLRAFVNHFLAFKEGRKPTEVQYSKALPEVI